MRFNVGSDSDTLFLAPPTGHYVQYSRAKSKKRGSKLLLLVKVVLRTKDELMETSRFDNQLLPGERVLWYGQPDKEAFAHGEQRLINWTVGFIVVWAIIFSVYDVSKYGISHFLPGGVKILAVPLVLALLIVVVSVFAPSRAGDYWYAVTNQRIFAEMPDEGSQTVIALLLSDVIKTSLQQKGNALGTVTIVANAKRRRKIYFRDIADAAEVCALLTDITSRPASA